MVKKKQILIPNLLKQRAKYLILQNDSLVTKFALTVVENKIPDVSNLVKKTDFNNKITEIGSKIPGVSGLVKKQTMLQK